MPSSLNELKTTQFSSRDAFLVVDGMQAAFIQDELPAAFDHAALLPLSLHAHAAGLRLKHPNLLRFFEDLDFESCMLDYRERALRRAPAWLQELGLEFRVGGIDVAELDAPNQFLFFLHARHIADLMEGTILRNPDITTFYAMTGETPCPLEFYFDSDVTAAVARHVCERMGRAIHLIAVPKLPRHLLPVRDSPSDELVESDVPVFPRTRDARVGLAPATIRNADDIRAALHRLGCDIVLFPSDLWDAPALGAMRHGESEFQYRLIDSRSSADDEDQRALANLFDRFVEQRAQSSLSPCIAANPHLRFQFEHIIKHRWLGYARMIRQAHRFVEANPVDLFIHCQHFTAEGAILARLYAQAGTKVMAAQHSGWPTDANWLSPKHADYALAWSKSCVKRLRDYDRRVNAVVTGNPHPAEFRDALAPQTSRRVTEHVRAVAGGRKIVLLLTNALELHAVPFVDFAKHFATLAVLARTPAHLADKILFLIRAKPAPIGEDPVIYEKLAGFPAQSNTLTAGLDLGQCAELADCVVGVNVPTTGYFEVFDKHVPLIHVQTCAALSLHPDLPSKIVNLVTEDSGVWAAIEPVLFEPRVRENLLNRQRNFIERDRTPSFERAADPIGAAIEYALGRRARFSLVDILRMRSPASLPAPVAQPAAPSGKTIVAPEAAQMASHIDRILTSTDRREVIVLGWAAARGPGYSVEKIHVFDADAWLGARRPAVARADVAKVFDDPGLRYSGFQVRCKLARPLDANALELYAELNDGSFHRMDLPQGVQQTAK